MRGALDTNAAPGPAAAVQPAEDDLPLHQHVFFAAFLILVCTFGFVDRFVQFHNLVDAAALVLTMLGFGGLVIQRSRRVTSQERLVIWGVALWLMALVISVLVASPTRGAVQAMLYVGYWGPLLLAVRISPRVAYEKYVPLLLLICLIQLPADWYYPLEGVDALDAFPGTFQIGNNKAKLLLMVLLYVVFSYRPRGVRRLMMPAFVVACAYSIYLGFSNAAYVGMAVALALAVGGRRRALFVTSAIVLVYAAWYLASEYGMEQEAIMNQERFLNPRYGVWAVYLFGAGALRDSAFLGVGLGEFITRTSQSMGGALLNKVPRTMVTFGDILNDVVAPSGVSAYLSIVVEAGIVGIILCAVLTLTLYREKAATRYGNALFIYLLIIIVSMPMFFEGPAGMVFAYFFVILSKAIRHTAPAVREAAP
jgi:hypothetical protein